MNGERIVLAAEPHDTLNWHDALRRAEQAEQIVWEMRLGLERAYFPFDDEMRFETCALALKQFTSDVWPQFGSKTAGLILYRGPLDIAERFAWNDRYRQSLAEDGVSERLFCVEVLAVYLQMLSHKLPDELEVLALFDERGIASCAEVLSLISKERFAHFVVGLRSDVLARDGLVWDEERLRLRRIPTTVGLVFPERQEPEFHARFNQLLEQESGRVVFEAFLTEEWEGLDELVVLDGSLSAQGLRKLKGFEAAGGEIKYSGMSAFQTQNGAP